MACFEGFVADRCDKPRAWATARREPFDYQWYTLAASLRHALARCSPQVRQLEHDLSALQAVERVAKEHLISTVAKATRRQIERNWKVIAASAGNSPAYHPTVREHHVTGLFEALGPGRLAEIAAVFATAPYDLRAGWPDLTLRQDDEVKFVEVKGPSDSFHASQARLISKLLPPLGFNVSLAEVRKRS